MIVFFTFFGKEVFDSFLKFDLVEEEKKDPNTLRREREQVFIVSKQQDDLDSRTIPTPQQINNVYGEYRPCNIHSAMYKRIKRSNKN